MRFCANPKCVWHNVHWKEEERFAGREIIEPYLSLEGKEISVKKICHTQNHPHDLGKDAIFNLCERCHDAVLFYLDKAGLL